MATLSQAFLSENECLALEYISSQGFAMARQIARKTNISIGYTHKIIQRLKLRKLVTSNKIADLNIKDSVVLGSRRDYISGREVIYSPTERAKLLYPYAKTSKVEASHQILLGIVREDLQKYLKIDRLFNDRQVESAPAIIGANAVQPDLTVFSGENKVCIELQNLHDRPVYIREKGLKYDGSSISHLLFVFCNKPNKGLALQYLGALGPWAGYAHISDLNNVYFDNNRLGSLKEFLAFSSKKPSDESYSQRYLSEIS